MAHRCFFFEPTDSQVQEDKTDMPELMMFPPTETGRVLLGTLRLCILQCHLYYIRALNLQSVINTAW